MKRLTDIKKSTGRLDVPVKLLPFLFFMFLTTGVVAQEPPPRPVTVTVSQNLGFGAFYIISSGGTITISTTGSRSSTGDIVLLGMAVPFSAAVFDVSGTPGTIVNITNGPDVTLTGSGGGTLTLHLGNSSPGSPFTINVSPPLSITLRLSGTLLVGSQVSTPAGNYSGSFIININQE